jgi:hypothetical protein
MTQKLPSDSVQAASWVLAVKCARVVQTNGLHMAA